MLQLLCSFVVLDSTDCITHENQDHNLSKTVNSFKLLAPVRDHDYATPYGKSLYCNRPMYN